MIRLDTTGIMPYRQRLVRRPLPGEDYRNSFAPAQPASRKLAARKRLPKTWKSRNIPRTTWCLSNARNACGINLGGARAES
ncbi:hypothetical protein EAG_15168 [Camponotus floridanus]|uniref:Uncharacterized protein n=1 Tax=Camponotus floridanus TaxID=104421 RepID=E2AQQ1_CAMFO|nr:hypothetical protein EAG_15168 [Camponotus floridanus]